MRRYELSNQISAHQLIAIGQRTNRLLWGKRINDFFEARIAAQRIPQRAQAQVAISVAARSFAERFKLPKRQFAFACPGTDDSEAKLYVWLSVCVFDAGCQFYCALAFGQCLFFSSQARIDQPEVSK